MIQAPVAERSAIALIPLISVATLALGLRIGSIPAIRAAMVFGAAPSNDHAGLAWQLVTILDDRGVRETVRLPDVTMLARSKGREARWRGGTNGDGVAEAWFDLPGISAGDPVWLEVRAPNQAAPLAVGPASWPASTTLEKATEPTFVRPSRRSGGLLIDVAVYGGRLAPGFSSSVWVWVRDALTGLGSAAVVVDADADPGLRIGAPQATTDTLGWAELRVTAEIHSVALGLRASAPEGTGSRGEWYGALPVAPGGAFVSVPSSIRSGLPYSFDVLLSTVVPRVYVEVDDAVGRAFAASLPVETSRNGAHASFDLRAVGPGTYWLVTSSDPGAAEGLKGNAIARPFVVAADDHELSRELGSQLSMLEAPRSSRFLALDGLPARRNAYGGRQRLGLALGLGSLLAAAVLETMLVLRVVRRSRRELTALEGREVEPRFAAANVLAGLLVAWLGFALLAALLTWDAAAHVP